ncbi:MAG: hypothetical protein K6F30_07935 [Lachnospiraceae bacterium]|nr:hypothetical protein [Lachnospiraceae bacterium]
MDKNDSILVHRFHDMATKASRSGGVVFSNFLNLNELNLLSEERNNLEASFDLFGGFSNAERQIACFQSDAFSLYSNKEIEYPMYCIQIDYASKKYAEKLSHRDVLGSLMNLGIERDLLGDIIFYKDSIYVFALQTAKELILSDLSKIRHTQVRTRVVPLDEFHYEPDYKECTIMIASNRLDAFVASVCNLSRQKSSEYILSEKVFINGKLITNHNSKLEEGDIVSLRGYGKLKVISFPGVTKKGKMKIIYWLYQ